MSWGSSWDKIVKPMQEAKAQFDSELADIGWLSAEPDEGWLKPAANADAKLLNDVFAQAADALVTIDHGVADATAYHLFKDGKFEQISETDFKQAEFKSVQLIEKHTNKVPTHDPYTNPNAVIYYECKCGAILDPGTKRFAELNNCASRAGWKIRFSDNGYIPYCVECGKGVE